MEVCDKMVIMDADVSRYELVLEEATGNYIRNEQGCALAHDKINDNLVYLKIDLDNKGEGNTEKEYPEKENVENNRWDRKGVLMLIDQFKFKSTTIKNESVWKEIAGNLAKEGHIYFHIKPIKQPNISPIAIASSSRAQNIDLQSESTDSDVFENKGVGKPPLKKRRTKADKYLQQMQEMGEKREENKRIRHEEMMNLQRETTKLFADKMDKLIDKL
ncbi:unnamed protein product [Brassicogethes aeneus]|uniref:Uncharacterized protein n=1 Tax=Brassicogethes aeneus TaxID=1431903 RepID=A0A9P0FNS1_BRAAE|nr:unnamed protein product [Brassicogethes aeneus]